MKKQELQYQYSETLIAVEPASRPRVFSAIQDMIHQSEEFKEISIEDVLLKFSANDILILNDTKVLPRRVFSQNNLANLDSDQSKLKSGILNADLIATENTNSCDFESEKLEILFLSSDDQIYWQVLFPSKKIKLGTKITLPDGIEMELITKGLPQVVKCSKILTEEYFEKFGDVPIPPYIQKVRNQRKSKPQDKNWYQTHWATYGGSFAAPTASLHFKKESIELLKNKNVMIEKVTLHVGMGTFLPVHSEDLKDHKMHKEEVFISSEVWKKIQMVKKNGGKVWALGTTVARALESVSEGKLIQTEEGYRGATDLLILPGFQFKEVDYLLTNFHQPESTLLALVYAFAGKEKVKAGYRLAIEKKFRLFSYGDLSIWKRA